MSEAGAAQLVTHKLWQSLFSPEKADVAIQCSDNIEVWCNRTALGAASHYFHCLLSCNWREGRSAAVKLSAVDSHLLQAYFLEFFKTGRTPPSSRADDLNVVLEAYELARSFNILRLEQLLLMQILHRMDISSAGWILARALDIQAFDLVGVAVDFLARAWCMGVTGVAITGMLPDALIQYLRSPLPRHDRIPEEFVLEAVIEWGAAQLGLDAALRQQEVSTEERQELARLLEPLLKRIRLEAIPPAILERRIEAAGLLSQSQLLEVYRAQAKKALPERPKNYVRSFWDSDLLPPSVNLIDPPTASFTASKGHQAVRSRLCLTRGQWQWRLRVEQIGKRFAWAGVVDASVDLGFFPGSQVGGYMYGSSGSLKSKGPLNQDQDRYGCSWHTDCTEVTVHLDMEARICSFSIDDKLQGPAFFDLPPCVYPAVSMGSGGAFKFLSIASACCEVGKG